MSQNAKHAQRREFLFDQPLPFIEQGQAPRASYAPSRELGGKVTWPGPHGFRRNVAMASCVIWDRGNSSEV